MKIKYKILDYIVIAITILALLGWIFDIKSLNYWGFAIPMNPFAALFILMLALFNIIKSYFFKTVVEILIFGFCVNAIMHYLLQSYNTIGYLLFNKSLNGNIIAANTAIAIILLIINSNLKNSSFILSAIICWISTNAIYGYILREPIYYSLGHNYGMALSSSICLLLLSIKQIHQKNNL